MRKIPSHYENPIDDIILHLCEWICPYFKKLNFTPNMITTFANILFFIALFFIYKKQYILAGIIYFISYIFDCIDGHYARKYDMVTTFGDYYDHIGDIIKLVIIIIIIYKISNSKILILIPIILWITTLIHLGCQEEIYDNSKSSESLAILRNFCKLKPKSQILYTRFFGCGTLYSAIMLIIFSFQFINK